jgi:hypothetical protein
LKPPLEGANAPVVHLRGRFLRPRRWSPGTECPHRCDFNRQWRTDLSDILYVFTRLNLLNAIDILLVALIIYGLFRLIQGTQAVQLLRGVIIVVLLTILITSILKLTAFSWLIRNSLSALLVAIPVIFQPE